jgi:hypothetical protein
MSNNIHGIGDYGRNRGQNNSYILGGGTQMYGNPREEGFFKFTRDFCCPMFVFKSFIFFISIVDIIFYLLTLFGGIKITPFELLAPTVQSLDNYGMKVIILFYLRILIKCKMVKYGDFLHLLYYMRISFISSLIFSLK